MLGEHRDDHSGIFRTLAFVDGCSVGGHQHVELAKSGCDRSAIKPGNELARIGIDVVDGANIAVVDLLFVVVLDLHYLVAGSKHPTKPLDLAIAGGSECGLQLDVQRPCAGAPRFIGHSTWMSRMGSRPNRL